MESKIKTKIHAFASRAFNPASRQNSRSNRKKESRAVNYTFIACPSPIWSSSTLYYFLGDLKSKGKEKRRSEPRGGKKKLGNQRVSRVDRDDDRVDRILQRSAGS